MRNLTVRLLREEYQVLRRKREIALSCGLKLTMGETFELLEISYYRKAIESGELKIPGKCFGANKTTVTLRLTDNGYEIIKKIRKYLLPDAGRIFYADIVRGIILFS